MGHGVPQYMENSPVSTNKANIAATVYTTLHWDLQREHGKDLMTCHLLENLTDEEVTNMLDIINSSGIYFAQVDGQVVCIETIGTKH